MELDYLSLPEIKKYQEGLLSNALDYLQHHSPFYQRMFATEHINPLHIRTLEDLQGIPFTEKIDLQRHNNDFICVPREKIVDYITTSGTLSDPVTFAMTYKDLERLAYNEKRAFTIGGTQPSDVFQLMTTIDKRFMAGLAYFMGLTKLGAGVIRVGNGIPELQWDTINRIHPNAIVCVPSFILKVISYAEQKGIDYQNSSIRRAYCIGENLREQDFSLNLLGKRITQKWDLQLFSTYASTEMATTFCECPQGRGGHLIPELIICELIDDKGHCVPEGEVGELTVTTLGVEGMPLLRFRTGDMACFHYERCGCGRNTPRIGPLVGRKNHMIKFKGTTLYPPALKDVLDNIPYVDLYQIILSDNDCGTDDVQIKVAVNTSDPYDNDETIKVLKDHFRARVRVAPNITLVPVDDLRKEVYIESQRKPLIIIDKRNRMSHE